MAELRYVDWDGLVYYDGKIKEHIRNLSEDFLKMGGIVSFENLPDPSWQNLNYIYKITDNFTSNDRFEKPGYVYEPGTWVQVVDLNETYLYTIFNEESIGGTADIDLNNYYTKSEVDSQIKKAIESIDNPEVDLDNYYTKDEVDKLIPDDFATQSDIDVLDKAVADVQASVEELQEAIDGINIPDVSNFATKEDLSVVEGKIPSIEGLATEEFVLKKIAEAELADQDVDLSAYYTKSETEAKIKEAVDAIEVPDVSNFATKEELSAVQQQSANNNVKIFQIEEELVNITSQLEDIPTNYATKQELQDAINSIEHPTVDLEGYATEEWVNNQGFAKVTDLPDVSNLATKDELTTVVNNIEENYVQNTTLEETIQNISNTYVTNETLQSANYVTEEYVQNQNFVTNQTLINNYTTTEHLEANYVTNNEVTELVTKEVTNVIDQKIEDGNLVVNADAINYDTF